MYIHPYLRTGVHEFRRLVEQVEDALGEPDGGPSTDGLEGPLAKALERARERLQKKAYDADREEYWDACFRFVDEFHRAFHLMVRDQMLSARISDHVRSGLGFPAHLRPRSRRAPVVDLRGLKAKLRRIPGLDLRASLAQELADELVEAAETDQLPEPLEIIYDTFPPDEEGPTNPLVLLDPYFGSPDAPVVKDEHRWDLATSRWLKKRSKAAVAIEQMKPPLTWAEVLYHYLMSLADLRGDPVVDRRRKEMTWHMHPATTAFCLDCDKTFEVSPHNPGRLVCPRCSDRRRKRRRRGPKQTTNTGS